MLIFELAIILLFSKLAGDLSVRLGQPAVLGKLLVGLVLGPSVLGLVENTDILKEISQIGVILLMFLAGLETDLEEFKKSGKAGTLVGLGGIILPFSAGYLSGMALGFGQLESIFLGLLLSATSVSISVQSLREMDKLKSREGATILSAAVIDDVVVMVLLAFLLGFAGGDVNLPLLIGKKAGYFLVAVLVGWKAVPWLMDRLSGIKVSEATLSLALIICFLFAYGAEVTGVAAIIGAYVAGVALSVTKQRDEVIHKVETVAYSIFVPVFFTSIGVAAELGGIGGAWGLAAVLSIVAIASKWLGSGFGAKWAGFDTRSSMGIGAAMVSRGEVALIIAAIGLENGMIDASFFTVIVLVVLVTTIVTPPLMKATFLPERRKGM